MCLVCVEDPRTLWNLGEGMSEKERAGMLGVQSLRYPATVVAVQRSPKAATAKQLC